MFGFDVAERMTGADKIKLVVGLLMVLAILAGAFCAGWAVNGWRLNAEHAEYVAASERVIGDLKSKIFTQNAAVDILQVRSQEANLRKKQAVEMNKATLAAMERRDAAVDGIPATDCDGILKAAHGDAR
jgi:hypothetical protein